MIDEPLPDEAEPADRPDWYDSQHAVLAAGAAALLLLVILAVAVIRMSGDTAHAPDLVPPATSFRTAPAPTGGSTSSSTSYTVPSPQTSEASLPPAAPSADVPRDDASEPEAPTTPSTPTTIFNPYVTTTQPAAGHV